MAKIKVVDGFVRVAGGSDGQVFLISTDTELGLATFLELSPEVARELATALNEAADKAEATQ